MLEIRTFEGHGDDLESFVTRTWLATYRGRLPVPLWHAGYFDWQLGLSEGAPRDHLLAAYDGGRLVGTVLGIPRRFRQGSEECDSTMGSWLSIDPEYRRQGVATQLRDEIRKRHADRGLRFQIGYNFFGARGSLAPSFWKQHRQEGTDFLCKAGFWVRTLDPPRAADWSLNRSEQWALRWIAPLQRSPRVDSRTLEIRDYQASDLASCLNLVAASTAKTDLGLVWQTPQLERQLQGRGVGQCLVAVDQGNLRGLVSFHCLPFQGRVEATVGILDLACYDGLSLSQQTSLLNAALLRLRQSGAVVALKLRIGDSPTAPYWMAGFLPRPADSYVILTWAGQRQPIGRIRRLHLLWR